MTKPDRFSRLVERSIVHTNHPLFKAGIVWRCEALRLLCAEHRAVVRLVQRRIKEVERGSQCQENISYRLALMDILVALRQRKEGR